MTRHVLIRADNGDSLVPESALPAEANLHDALAANPQLIPSADVGLGRMAVVGRESSLASGYADLILVDELGQLCLVEVKKEGNPDTRQVVAQLFDYAASLWGQTLDEFTERVLRPYLRGIGQPESTSLDDFLAAAFVSEEDVDATETSSGELTLQGLSATLERGNFVLVVAAPEIPPGVERVLDYLNGQGLRLYGLEVGYFRGQVECFVPRVTVQPPRVTQPSRGAAIPVDREEFLESLGEGVGSVVATALDRCAEARARVEWDSFGAKIKVALDRKKQVGHFDRRSVGVMTRPPNGFAAEPFERAKQRLDEIGLGELRANAWYRRIPYDNATAEQLEDVTDVLVDLCQELTDRVAWEELPAPHEESFTRNDYNVWLRQAPGLEPFRGMHMRGTLFRVADAAHASVDLTPVARDAPGWVPRFSATQARDTVWPPGSHGGEYRLQITAIGRPREPPTR